MVVEAFNSKIVIYSLNMTINGTICGTFCLFDEKQMKAHDHCSFLHKVMTS